MNLRKRIEEKLVAPIIRSNVSKTIIAEVVDTHKFVNSCDIKYKDNEGNIRNNNYVSVRVTDPDQNWFPKKGDIVYVLDEGGNQWITGKFINYDEDIKDGKKLTQDISSDGGGSVGGMII